MKSVKLTLFAIAIASTLFSCKKGEDGGPDCEDDNTTTVVFTNNGTVALRVQVAIQLTPQYVPIDPVVTLDLAPGATSTKVIKADRYMIVWNRNCSTTCSLVTSYAKTYDACSSNEEIRGI